MGIILVNKLVQAFLQQTLVTVHTDAALLIPEIYPVDVYKPSDVTQLIEYYSKQPVKVKAGYPVETVQSPSVYVAPGDERFDEETIGWAERYEIAPDLIGTLEAKLYNKTCRIVSASDNATVSDTLAGICRYLLQQNEEAFKQYGMSDLHCNVQELDLISRLYPQEFFYRTFVVTFTVIDTMIVSKDHLIKEININNIDLSLYNS